MGAGEIDPAAAATTLLVYAASELRLICVNGAGTEVGDDIVVASDEDDCVGNVEPPALDVIAGAGEHDFCFDKCWCKDAGVITGGVATEVGV